MKERIEFVDGSYYEFDRASEVLMAEMLGKIINISYFTRIGDASDGVYDRLVTSYLPHVYFKSVTHPDDKSFGDTMAAWHNTHGNFNPCKVAKISDAVLTVAIVNYKSCEELKEFGPGLYIPVFYNINVLGSLLSDLSLVTSKVIYEPKLITAKTKKALNSTNHYDRTI